MKKFLLFLMLALTGGAMKCAAQDVIVKKDGSTIVSKVLEITSTEVKYKKFTNQNGPTYTILKDEVQAINYENGEKDVFETATSNQIQQNLTHSTLYLNSQASVNDQSLLEMTGYSKELEKAKRLKIAGLIAGPTAILTGAIMFAAGMGAWEDIYDSDGLAIAGCIMAAGGISTMIGCLARAHKLKSQSFYSLNTMPLYQYSIAFNNGTSLFTGVDFLKDNHLHTQTLGLGIRYNF